MDDNEIENQIQDKGLTAPRVVPDDLDKAIQKVEYHLFPGSQMTICCITMINGFNTIGESACVDPANFNKELGEQIAFGKAKNAMWPLLGFLLKEEQYQKKNSSKSDIITHPNQTTIDDFEDETRL